MTRISPVWLGILNSHWNKSQLIVVPQRAGSTSIHFFTVFEPAIFLPINMCNWLFISPSETPTLYEIFMIKQWEKMLEIRRSHVGGIILCAVLYLLRVAGSATVYQPNTNPSTETPSVDPSRLQNASTLMWTM